MRIQAGDLNKGTFQLIYVSSATIDVTVDDLRELATLSQANNKTLDITGVLIYHRRLFLQVLEGDVISVNRLLDRIRHDWRHKDVDVVSENTIAQRHFADWQMQPTTPEDVLTPNGTIYTKLFESAARTSYAEEAETLFVMSAFSREGRQAFAK